MSELLAVATVIFDETIYPRAKWSQATVNRYAEALNAGDEFPPIVLEPESNRLLDGMHRLQAHKQALRNEIAVVWQPIPDGVPPRLFTASLSARHGDRLTGEELRQIAREIYEVNPDYDLQTIAKHTGVTRQTVGKWVGDIIEHRQSVRAMVILLLGRVGWSQKQIADRLGISQPSVSRIRNVTADIANIDEGLLREAAAEMPEGIDTEVLVEEIRQERIFGSWSEEERDLLKRLRDGETIVVSLRAHNDLIGWADAAGLYMRIDRRSEWGNPFEMPDDGDRDTVTANYAAHYLLFKPSLLSKLDTLRGKALGCWCAPERCHGDVLIEFMESPC